MIPYGDPSRDDDESEEPDPILKAGDRRRPAPVKTAVRDLHQANVERAVVGPPERAVRIPAVRKP